jgi:hypothetical protein
MRELLNGTLGELFMASRVEEIQPTEEETRGRWE